MRIIKLPIFVDFSISGCNLMLDLARKNNLGIPLKFEYSKNTSTWWLECQFGKIISDCVLT